MKIQAKKISKKSLFKLIIISTSISFLVFFLICGVVSIFGAPTIRINDRPVTGIKGLVAAIVMYPIFCLITSFFAWLGSIFGLWIYSLFRKIELEFVEAEIIDTM